MAESEFHKIRGLNRESGAAVPEARAQFRGRGVLVEAHPGHLDHRLPGIGEGLEPCHRAVGPDAVGRQKHGGDVVPVGATQRVGVTPRHRRVRQHNRLRNRLDLDRDEARESPEGVAIPQSRDILGAGVEEIATVRRLRNRRKIAPGQQGGQADRLEKLDMTRAPDWGRKIKTHECFSLGQPSEYTAAGRSTSSRSPDPSGRRSPAKFR